MNLQTNNIYNTDLQKITYTYHPSVTPLKKFHGHFIKVLSLLPSNGKYSEILKRVALAVASTFAYLLLGVIGLLFYPIKKSLTINNLDDLLFHSNIVKSITVSDICKERMPCEHQCVIELIDQTKWQITYEKKCIDKIFQTVETDKIKCNIPANHFK